MLKKGAHMPRVRVLVVAAILSAVGMLLPLGHPNAAVADETLAGQDLLRTGWDQAEPNLSPSAVAGSNFGQLFATQLNGQVYAQPLIVGTTVLVSTENDWIYGL